MVKIIGGHPPFVGARDNIAIYRMKGRYFIRTKSSLTGKRVKRDPAFAKTMAYAGWLKKASGIASLIYKQIPENGRVYKQHRELYNLPAQTRAAAFMLSKAPINSRN